MEEIGPGIVVEGELPKREPGMKGTGRYVEKYLV